MDPAIYARIKEFALGLSDGDSIQVKSACSEITPNAPDSALAIQHLRSRALRADFLSLVNCLRNPHPELLGAQLFTLLQAIRVTSTEIRPPTLNLAWTGPKSPKLPVRLTEQVLLELIDEANSELYIVAFAFYRANLVKSAIKRAVSRGVHVTMLMESSAAENGTTDFDMISKLRKELGTTVRFLEWPPLQRERDSKGNVGALHVKCAIADRSRAFISSANLTDFAMTLNMELGVEIKDAGMAERLSLHFEALESLGILQSLPGPQK